MAFYTVTVSASEYYVEELDSVSTECSTLFGYNIVATSGDAIDITLVGDAINSYYIKDGITTTFADNASVTFSDTLELYYSIENSGITGVYDNVAVSIQNNTTSQPYTLYENINTRQNDSAKCNDSSNCCGGGSGTTNEIASPQLFNPQLAEVGTGTATFGLAYSGNIVFITVNGQVIDDSEYNQAGSVLTVTPDNGFYDVADEVLVFQYTSTTGNVDEPNFRTVTASGGVLDTDDVIEVTTSGITLQMITAVGNAGKQITIKNTSGADIYVDGFATETLEGVLILTIPDATSYKLVSNGTNWIAV